MKTKIRWLVRVGVFVICTMLVGLQPFVTGVANAQTDEDQPLPAKIVDLNDIRDGRGGKVAELAAYWAEPLGESVETLGQALDNASTAQLLLIDGAQDAAEVRTVLDIGDYLGDTDRDLVYTPVNPCLIVDTRVGGGGFIYPNQERDYYVYGGLGFQGGAANCPSPRGEPRAVHLNMVAVDVTGRGNLQAYPEGGVPGTGGLSVNFANIGTNLANAGTVKTCYLCGPEITVSSRYAGSHAFISVLGYYHEVHKDDADRLALAYAHVTSAAGFYSRTENVASVTWNASSSRYEITIAGENFYYTDYSVVVTPISPNDLTIRTTSFGGRLIIYFRDAIPAGEGDLVQAEFSFVVFKNQ